MNKIISAASADGVSFSSSTNLRSHRSGYSSCQPSRGTITARSSENHKVIIITPLSSEASSPQSRQYSRVLSSQYLKTHPIIALQHDRANLDHASAGSSDNNQTLCDICNSHLPAILIVEGVQTECDHTQSLPSRCFESLDSEIERAWARLADAIMLQSAKDATRKYPSQLYRCLRKTLGLVRFAAKYQRQEKDLKFCNGSRFAYRKRK